MEIPEEVLDAVVEVELGLLMIPGVTGVGVGLREVDGEVFDDLAVRILVEDLDDLPAGLPDALAGVDVCLVQRSYEPLAGSDLKRYPDLHGGIHITNPNHSDHGTLGAIVQDTSAIASGQLLGLSCFHVVGDRGAVFPFTVWQPNSPPPFPPPVPRDDNIGRVMKAAFPNIALTSGPDPIRVGGFDAAVFDLDEAFTHHRTASRHIMGQDAQQPNLADAITATDRAIRPEIEVSKRGAMTRVTHGKVVSPRLSMPWRTPFGPNRFMIASIELRVDRARNGGDLVFARPGDSGSVVVLGNDPTTAVGLLWGGDDTGSWAAMTDIQLLEAELEISLVWA
ncbi:hypothetical protein [Saccharothrix stipae]